METAGKDVAGGSTKTNAMRALDAAGVPYTVHHYDATIKSATDVARVLGLPANTVYKTLVLLREGGGRPMLVMVPGDKEIALRALAREIGAKAVRMAPKADAERLTGLQTGGIGALALLNRPFDVYIDRDALQRNEILVNGGRRGLNVQVPVKDLLAMTGATPVATDES